MGCEQSKYAPPVVMGSNELMRRKRHGTCDRGVQKQLRFGVDRKKADKICCYNRRLAEYAQYFRDTNFLAEIDEAKYNQFFDSVHGQRVCVAPVGRTLQQFLRESQVHGWPSFRDREIDWEHVRVLQGGEVVTVGGVHLGHNLPDSKGNRYCLNLVSIAGFPKSSDHELIVETPEAMEPQSM